MLLSKQIIMIKRTPIASKNKYESLHVLDYYRNMIEEEIQ